MKKIILILISLVLTVNVFSAQFSVKLKDIARFGKDNRDNQIIGYGLVGGLEGTGDKNQLSINSAINFLNNFGIVTNSTDFTSKNIAAVVITATLPAFARSGDKIDVTVSSIGDAKDLQGGVLFQTPLVGPDKKVYALAAGPISIGGFNAGLGGGGSQKNHVTVARIPNGATVEQEVKTEFIVDDKLEIVLKDKDFNMAEKVKKVIEEKYGRNRAIAKDAGLVEVDVPFSFREDPISFIAKLENLEIVPESKAKIVINEKTGSVVISESVRISPVAISHGELSITVNGQGDQGVVELENGNTLKEIVDSLNAMGAGPRDLIAILQLMKEAGAIHADLQII
ncbi:MAG: flagellar biosynthesis protein FlgA [Candidatus Muiribacterium halophilum]|uniref:Flagellar P-ring protein n=1 Tax=Muiribacterium halophilum TaxID=2053465 RepID=A0A2N5ZCF9_MUIH1|nr:MAG: flagellar biosynthesis protein FlgA [Candidatus Muirbacterium halophilum]